MTALAGYIKVRKELIRAYMTFLKLILSVRSVSVKLRHVRRLPKTIIDSRSVSIPKCIIKRSSKVLRIEIQYSDSVEVDEALIISCCMSSLTVVSSVKTILRSTSFLVPMLLAIISNIISLPNFITNIALAATLGAGAAGVFEWFKVVTIGKRFKKLLEAHRYLYATDNTYINAYTLASKVLDRIVRKRSSSSLKVRDIIDEDIKNLYEFLENIIKTR